MNKKLALIVILLVLALSSSLVFYAFYNKKISETELELSNTFFTQKSTQRKPLLSFLVISDTHLNKDAYEYLARNIDKWNPSFLVHLGDHTNFGTIEELSQAKNLIESLNIKYYTLAGDHDIAETSSMDNFQQVFSLPSPISIEGINISFLNNPYNVLPFRTIELEYNRKAIESGDIVLTSQPIYVDKDNFFNYKFMGSTENMDQLSQSNQLLLKKYSQQSTYLQEILRNTNTKKLIISGDHHRSSTFTDPNNNLITYHIVGALSKSIYLGTKEISQKSLQSQRLSQVDVFKVNGKLEFEITEHIIEN